MAAPALRIEPSRAPEARLDVEIVVPVYNEEQTLRPSIERLREFLSSEFPLTWQIVIADNASSDGTLDAASRLSHELDGVEVLHLRRKGRGRALRAAWLASPARVVCYMDVDLSTDLRALLPLVAPLISGHSDLAIGTRLASSARVVRGPKREVISRGYNLILHGALSTSFSDAQCGFKAIRSDIAADLLPMVEDNNWFFDTELLVIAQRAGLRIHQGPVDWVDDPRSSGNTIAPAKEALAGIARLLHGFARGQIPVARLRAELGRDGAVPSTAPGVPRGVLGQLLPSGVVGLLSTVAYFLLYLGLHGTAGPQAANLIALLATAV